MVVIVSYMVYWGDGFGILLIGILWEGENEEV